MTLTDPNPVFKFTVFLNPNISKTGCFRDKISTVRFRDTVTKEH